MSLMIDRRSTRPAANSEFGRGYRSYIYDDRRYVTSLGTTEERRLDTLARLGDDWDGFGSNAPTEESIDAARGWLRTLRGQAAMDGRSWAIPHLSASETGEIVAEWWYDNRSLTVCFSQPIPIYLKVWGAHVHDEMHESRLDSPATFAGLWRWLTA